MPIQTKNSAGALAIRWDDWLEGYRRPVIVCLGGGSLPTHAAFIGIVCPFPTHLHGPDDFDIGTIAGGVEWRHSGQISQLYFG